MIDPNRVAEAAKRIARKLNPLNRQGLVLSVVGQKESVPFNLDDDGTGIVVVAHGAVAKRLMAWIHEQSVGCEIEKVPLQPPGEEELSN